MMNGKEGMSKIQAESEYKNRNCLVIEHFIRVEAKLNLYDN